MFLVLHLYLELYRRPYKPRHEASYLLMLYAAATTCVLHFHSVSTKVCTAKLAWEYFLKLIWIFWIILFKWIILILDYIVVGCIGLYCCGLFWVILLWIITESISNGMKDNITHDGCCVFRGGTHKSHVAVITLKCEAASCLCLFTVFGCTVCCENKATKRNYFS